MVILTCPQCKENYDVDKHPLCPNCAQLEEDIKGKRLQMIGIVLFVVLFILPILACGTCYAVYATGPTDAEGFGQTNTTEP